MKKICYLLENISLKGGAERITVSVANSLAEKNEIFILSIAEFKREELVFDVNLNVELFSLNFKDWGEKNSIRDNYFSLVRLLRKFIYLNKIDVLINVQAIHMLWTLPATFGLKTNVFCWEHSNYNSHKFFTYNICITLAKFYADLIIVLTERDRKLWNTDKAVLMLNFPAFNMPYVSVSEKQKFFVAVGRFSHEKAFNRLIDIWEIVEKSIDLNGYHLELIGEGEQEEFLRKMITEKGLKSIKIIPFTKQIDLKYQKASAIFMTSLFEGYPMVLIEALQFGVPAIAFDVLTGPAEIIVPNKTGFLIEDGNKVQFAEKIMQIVNDSKLLSDLQSNNLEHRKSFDSNSIINKWNLLLQDNY